MPTKRPLKSIAHLSSIPRIGVTFALLTGCFSALFVLFLILTDVYYYYPKGAVINSLGAALFFSAPLLVGIFTKSREVITLGSTVLRMVAVSEPFYGVSIIMEGLMMGVGKTKVPFLYNITGMWCIRILGAIICIRFLEMGLVFAWACIIAHNMLLFCFYLATFVRGSWNPLNTE